MTGAQFPFYPTTRPRAQNGPSSPPPETKEETVRRLLREMNVLYTTLKILEEPLSFSRETFVDWLTDRPHTEIVGSTTSPTSCPLANCLRETYGVEWAAAGTGICALLHDGVTTVYKTPQWARQFIDALESEANDWGWLTTTAEEAQQMVERIRGA